MLVFGYMQTIDSLSNTISQIVPKYAFVLDTGSIIKSTISEENILQLAKFLPKICKDLKPGSYIHKSKLFIYRLTTNFVVFLLSDKDKQEIITLLEDIGQGFTLKIAREFKLHPNSSLGSIIRSIVFSVTTEKGPELMDWIVNDKENSVDDKDAYKIAMKTMLNLTDELEGAKKKVLFFQPFLMYDALGISYLFQIPFPGARGGSFDSALTVLVDFKHRAVMYSLYKELEEILHNFEPKITKEFQNVYQDDICLSKDDFNGTLVDLRNRIDRLNFKILDSEVLMDEMINAVRELNDI